MPETRLTGRTAYDIVSYPGYAYPQTHPDHIASLAHLCGLNSAPVETCRVLEIGCGDAANLIPMALGLPRANFRGFDLASTAIERGRSLAGELGLSNITLDHLDICDVPDRMGEFDYVIAHGFYSWVPEIARDKLMTICKASLAPQGVAFISYNTLPGGHVRRMIREMLLFHVENAPDPETQFEQARALLGFLSNLNQGNDEYEVLLKKEFERAMKHSPGLLVHDDLAPVNHPVYLLEFVGHAGAHGLQFLGDLNSSFVAVGDLDPDTATALTQLEVDPVRREQYLDFARCRRFRQTLLCHDNLAVHHRPDPQRIQGLWVSSPAVPVSQNPDLSAGIEEEFREGSASLKTAHPLMKAAMVALRSVWPKRLLLDELRANVAAILEVPLDSVPVTTLSEGLLTAFMLRVVDLHVYHPQVARKPGDRPRTNPLLRLQAKEGALLTNLLHKNVKIDERSAQLLALLDGRRTSAELAAELQISVEQIDETLGHFTNLALLEE